MADTCNPKEKVKVKTALRMHMEKHGVRLEDLSHKTGMPYSTIRHLYYGNNVNPGIVNATNVLDALEIEYSLPLFDGKEIK